MNEDQRFDRCQSFYRVDSRDRGNLPRSLIRLALNVVVKRHIGKFGPTQTLGAQFRHVEFAFRKLEKQILRLKCPRNHMHKQLGNLQTHLHESIVDVQPMSDEPLLDSQILVLHDEM